MDVNIFRLGTYIINKSGHITSDGFKVLFEDFVSRLDMELRQTHIETSETFDMDDAKTLNDVNCDMKQIEKHFQKPINTMERKIFVGRHYKHFKGKIVKVIAIGRHTEYTDELFVVYEYRGSVWCRPYEMFAGLVDKEKYPNCKQKYRFQLVSVMK